VQEPESPFARTPAPGATGPPSGLTWESQVDRAGELSTGLSRQPKAIRIFGRLIIAVPLLALLLVIVVMAIAVIGGLITS
jgi:hypothetical protein